MYTLTQPVKKKKGTGKKGAKSAGGKKKGKSKGKGTGKKKAKSAVEKRVPPVPDPFSYAAMLNAYYIAHGPVHFLELRGYGASTGGGGGSKKKKGGGKKKKK